jgi:hypothetical protein
MARAVVNEAYRWNDMYNCDKPDRWNDVCKYIERDCWNDTWNCDEHEINVRIYYAEI